MKKTILILAAAVFAVSCSKNDGNKGVIKDEHTETAEITQHEANDSTYIPDGQEYTIADSYTYRYVAEDGTNSHVTFTNTKEENSISITSNNKTITLPQTEVWAKGAVYKDHDIEVISKGDSLKITQGNNVIELKKAGGQ